jgi:hypothetical protein
VLGNLSCRSVILISGFRDKDRSEQPAKEMKYEMMTANTLHLI